MRESCGLSSCLPDCCFSSLLFPSLCSRLPSCGCWLPCIILLSCFLAACWRAHLLCCLLSLFYGPAKARFSRACKGPGPLSSPTGVLVFPVGRVAFFRAFGSAHTGGCLYWHGQRPLGFWLGKSSGPCLWIDPTRKGGWRWSGSFPERFWRHGPE